MDPVPRPPRVSLLDLPSEVLYNVACICQGHSRKTLRATCKAFHNIHKPTSIRLVGEWVDSGHQDLVTADQLSARWPQVTCAHVVRVRNCTALEPDDDHDVPLTRIAEALTNWSQLRSVACSWHVQVVQAIAKCCCNIQRLELCEIPCLTFKARDMAVFGCLSALAGCSTLKELKLEIDAAVDDQVNHSPKPLHWQALAKLTQLESLDVYLQYLDMCWHPEFSIHDVNHALECLTRLTHLNLNLEFVDIDEPLSITALASLRSLHAFIKHDNVTAKDVLSLLPPCCLQLTELRTAKLATSAAFLQPLVELVKVTLTRTLLEEATLLTLASSCPQLESLAVGGIRLKTGFTGVLPSLRQLEIFHRNAIWCSVPLSTVAPRLESMSIKCFIMAEDEGGEAVPEHIPPARSLSPYLYDGCNLSFLQSHQTLARLVLPVTYLVKPADGIHALATMSTMTQLHLMLDLFPSRVTSRALPGSHSEVPPWSLSPGQQPFLQLRDLTLEYCMPDWLLQCMSLLPEIAPELRVLRFHGGTANVRRSVAKALVEATSILQSLHLLTVVELHLALLVSGVDDRGAMGDDVAVGAFSYLTAFLTSLGKVASIREVCLIDGKDHWLGHNESPSYISTVQCQIEAAYQQQPIHFHVRW